LVEDSPGDAALIVELLAEQAAPRDAVLEARSLRQANAVLAGQRVDLILLDLRLPDAEGVDCVRRVRAVAADAPIVVLTGLDDESLALSCLEAGAQDYLSKTDLRPQDLKRAMGYAIARSRELAEQRRAEILQLRLAAIVESSGDAIISTNTAGEISSWNRGAEAIFGYSPPEAMGRPLLELIPPAEDAPQTEAGWLAKVLGAERTELTHLRRDGARVVLSVVASQLKDAEGRTTGVAAICRDVSERRRRDEELRRHNDELLARDQQMRALAARLHAVREEERSRISREVHDELGQLLTGLKMDLRWVGRRLGSEHSVAPSVIAERLREAEQLVDRTIETIQRIAIELRPSALDALGLPAALRDEARRFERRTGLATEVEVQETVQLTSEVATQLFRIFQELLTNVARHAEATLVRVLFQESPQGWTLRVDDNGVGLRGNIDDLRSSPGILGMRERAESLGGQVELSSEAGLGTQVQVRIPRAPGPVSHAEHPHR
jgi:two-component system sensor histidine kinase UhpB